MEWKTTDTGAYQPRSIWKLDQIPDLPCVRGLPEQEDSIDYARNASQDEFNRIFDAITRAVAPFPDARRAVIEAVKPFDPPPHRS